MKTICLLGATGSIGTSTLDIIERHPEKYQLHSVSGHKNWQKMHEIIQRFQPKVVVMSDEQSALTLKEAMNDSTVEVLTGEDALIQIAKDPIADTVVAAIVGSAGLQSSYAAVCAGKRVLLANKESLVISGQLFMSAVKKYGATLLPVDSEHNAIFQSLPFDYQQGKSGQGVKKILLTASGGPFLKFSQQQLENVTPEQAVAHPNWSMGQKISVDSASLMNKGLELIEACWLFDLKVEDVQVVVHPQSIIHSMVSYADGSVIAQMGNPDMRTPIAYGLSYPERIESGVEPLDFFQINQLTFDQADESRFECLALAKQAFAQGGIMPAILNAANEEAVDAFLNNNIAFLDIAKVVKQTMSNIKNDEVVSIDQLMQVDVLARTEAINIIKGM
ncbi:1-deoxy-D-xylulose-5-phosphate reductoisomerase [Marinicellulosiphila megalodicopiae]|uniref:1-deoxy-D-xylulose-5-phosphate reductoisomerase n=1 Tax=Marinicellulosiphila megalodicopiae TaxID=2724896 RepID=UPI003BB03270